MFLGSALLAMGLLVVGMLSNTINEETPEWLWVVSILLIDVAHVYSTAFRVYFDREELTRRPWLYGLTPLLALVIGAAVYSEDSQLFWRLLAYLAVFHFVRQQYGWVALYRAKAGERDRLSWWIDASAIYLATIYPLAWWHASLPRKFHWFIDGDFVNLPHLLVKVLQPLYWLSLAAYAIHSFYRFAWKNECNPGKDIVVATTAICWHVGIISMNSDYAFTVTNVIIHGVPYLVLVYRMQRFKPHPSTIRTSPAKRKRQSFTHALGRFNSLVPAGRWPLSKSYFGTTESGRNVRGSSDRSQPFMKPIAFSSRCSRCLRSLTMCWMALSGNADSIAICRLWSILWQPNPWRSSIVADVSTICGNARSCVHRNWSSLRFILKGSKRLAGGRQQAHHRSLSANEFHPEGMTEPCFWHPCQGAIAGFDSNRWWRFAYHRLPFRTAPR